MKELINRFPRQAGLPVKVTCLNEIDFYNFINRYNGIKKKIYVSLYDCDESGCFERAKIDKISFDLDNNKSLENALKISDFCFENNYRHCIIFSTGGYWVHIKTKNYENLRNKKDALRNAQHDICLKLNLSIGDNPKVDDVDFHIIGDIARITRMPGTLDLTRGLFCQSIPIEDLKMKDQNHISCIARKQRNRIYWYGRDALDISKYDTEISTYRVEMPDYEHDYDEELTEFPPCIIDILKDNNGKGNWRGRWLATVYFKEIGYPQSLVDQIAKKYFGAIERSDAIPTNYEHWKMVNCLGLVFRKDNLIFPDCETLYKDGFCKGKCKFYNKLYR